MPIMECITGHPDVKADLSRLLSETVPLGAQRGFDGTVDCYLRNCLRCGSTMGIEVTTAALLADANAPQPGAAGPRE